MTGAIVFDGATVALGPRIVLDRASFAISSGAFVALLGPNGAGKTTLLRTVLGLVPVRGGRVAVLGERPGTQPARIGYMPQARTLAARGLRGRDYLRAALAGVPAGSLPRGPAHEMARVLDLVDGAALAARPVGYLSGGERQRLALAQALLGQPEIVLLDEPLASLDPARMDDVVGLIDALRRTLGLTVVLSAHDINPLMRAVSDVLYVAGQQARLGSVEAVITGPVLSALYGAPVDVVRAGGRIFVMSGAVSAAGPDCHAHG